MKIEAVTANEKFLLTFFSYSQECLYLDHRVAVLENPGQGPSISRRFPKSEALAEEFGNLLLMRGPRPGFSNTATLRSR